VERLKALRDIPAPNNSQTLKRIPGMFAYYAKWIAGFSDKAHPLIHNKTFPIEGPALKSFINLKSELEKATLKPLNENEEFVVECDASDVAVSATLNQEGRPVAFMSRTLNNHERHYPAVEKEATAIIESIRKWSQFLQGKHFTLITDQRSVSFMLDNRKRSKIKNSKIQQWRMELAGFDYTIKYRPGQENVAPDAFTRSYCQDQCPT